MAAGLVIEESRMDDFRRAFNRYVSETTTEEQRSPVLNIDMEVSFQALTLDLLDSYEKLEPFGNSNPQPLFMSSDVFPTEPPKRVGTNHLKLFMRQGIVERDAIFSTERNGSFPILPGISLSRLTATCTAAAPPRPFPFRKYVPTGNVENGLLL